ncbi:hypothetical protein [Amycolatopsis sp. PS_44_ISF1]|uniref:Rv1733c family protein n=1 Tax=Amycolatopsis sp. PS_44_ISF1 TaxID=2974917 RepID=UPI0028DD9D01|nr:hypothetical protein [Amycolatopsis sp. PS_44_ISF1]MDT8911818.1 hypothetical protein [Amycolatopsis sp. PS_44_ISF1]
MRNTVRGARPPHLCRRVLRRLGAVGNPLVRRSDRLEGLILATTVLLALLALPLVVALGRADVAMEESAADAQTGSRHQVTATVLKTAPQPASVGDGAPITQHSRVTARWRLPHGGAPHTGVVTVPAGDAAAGSRTPIWLDHRGRQTTAPLTRADAVTNGVLVGAFAWLCAIGLLAGAYWVARGVLDRRRAARWAAEWQQFAGPEAVR